MLKKKEIERKNKKEFFWKLKLKNLIEELFKKKFRRDK